jgi:hypothetical protein
MKDTQPHTPKTQSPSSTPPIASALEKPCFTPDQLQTYAEHLQRLHPEELGFLPRLAIQEYAHRGQIILATQNDQPAAYALFYDGRNNKRPRRHPFSLHVHQICTQDDALFLQHATSLLRRLELRAQRNHMTAITAWVAHDIPATAFWEATGFTQIASRKGGAKRNRIHRLYKKLIPPNPDQKDFLHDRSFPGHPISTTSPRTEASPTTRSEGLPPGPKLPRPPDQKHFLQDSNFSLNPLTRTSPTTEASPATRA